MSLAKSLSLCGYIFLHQPKIFVGPHLRSTSLAEIVLGNPEIMEHIMLYHRIRKLRFLANAGSFNWLLNLSDFFPLLPLCTS